MRLALFEPDIPQNTGTILRLASCLGIAIDIIGPCGFVWSDRLLRRAGMDYLDRVDCCHYSSWSEYEASHQGRILLLTTHGDYLYTEFHFSSDDTLLLGRESAGVPDTVHASADGRLRIPMRAGERALNVAVAASMVVGEALRQTQSFPSD